MALPSLAMNCDRGYLSDSDLSSRLSSPASETPSPPPELRPEVAYPSPPRSTESSQSGSPVPDGMDSRNTSDQDGPPPAKRRRISERKPRTTEYLDLRSGHVKPGQESQLDRLLHTIHKRQKIVVVAGAGISVSAGSKCASFWWLCGDVANGCAQYPTSDHLPVYSPASGRSIT